VRDESPLTGAALSLTGAALSLIGAEESLIGAEESLTGVDGGGSGWTLGGTGAGTAVEEEADSAHASMSDIHRSSALYPSIRSDSVHAAQQPGSDALQPGRGPARHGGLGKTVGGVSLTGEEEATAKSWAFVRPAEERAILAPGKAQSVPLSGWGWAAGPQET
jgi:hypothetical protein